MFNLLIDEDFIFMPLKLSLLVLPFITDPCRTFTIFDFNFDMMTPTPYIFRKAFGASYLSSTNITLF